MAKLLIVDDAEAIRTSLRDVLVDEGFDVVLARGGEEALALLTSESFDAVLLDLYMPVMNGWTLLAKKAQSPGAAIPVVVLSAQRLAEPPPGVFALMEKPCRLEHLLEVVRAATERAPVLV